MGFLKLQSHLFFFRIPRIRNLHHLITLFWGSDSTGKFHWTFWPLPGFSFAHIRQWRPHTGLYPRYNVDSARRTARLVSPCSEMTHVSFPRVHALSANSIVGHGWGPPQNANCIIAWSHIFCNYILVQNTIFCEERLLTPLLI